MAAKGPPPDLLEGHVHHRTSDISELEASLDQLSVTIKEDKKTPSSRRHVRGTGLVYHESMAEPHCLWDPDYEENPKRFTGILNRIRELGLEERCVRIDARPATEAEVRTVHSEELLEKVKSTAGLTDQVRLEQLSSEFDAIYFHPKTYEQSLLSAGSTVDMVTAIVENRIKNGFALVRPPGHHAMQSEACGYCYFNNVAIAAKHAVDNLGLDRVLIVDWDVHHGQATQYTFNEDPRVFYMSIHRYEHGAFWPELIESNSNWVGTGSGTGFNCNVPLNEIGINDRDYLAIFHNVLLPLAYRFDPQLVIVSAGFDAAIGCPEGEMRVSPATYAHFTHHLMSLANGRLCVALEGGYCINSLAEGAALTLRSLLGDPCPSIVPLPSLRLHRSLVESILDVVWAMRTHWPDDFPLQGHFDRHDGALDEGAGQLPLDILRPRHYPVVEYRGTLAFQENRPSSYPTRNCCPVQAPEVKTALEGQISALIEATNISSPFIAKKSTCLVYDERMCVHKAADQSHPERASRVKAIWKKLTADGLVERCNVLEAREVSNDELYLVHSREHVMKMNHLSDLGHSELRDLANSYDSIYLNKMSNSAAKLAVGSLLQVVDSVLSGHHLNGFAVIRPPGHHASATAASGFCIYNNVAIAAKYAIKNFRLKRVLIFDWDVHHGDGTQKAVVGDEAILYISTHRYEYAEFFPSSIVSSSKTGAKNIVNIPFNNDQMSDSEYLAAFLNIVLPVATDFQPELVLISAGFDAAINDPLGHYAVSPAAYGHFTHHLMSLANGRVVAALEGGYNLVSIAAAASSVVSALLGDPLDSLELSKTLSSSASESLKEVVDYHATNWPSLQFGVDLPQSADLK